MRIVCKQDRCIQTSDQYYYYLNVFRSLKFNNNYAKYQFTLLFLENAYAEVLIYFFQNKLHDYNNVVLKEEKITGYVRYKYVCSWLLYIVYIFL